MKDMKDMKPIRQFKIFFVSFMIFMVRKSLFSVTRVAYRPGSAPLPDL
jgi:hypothetical protein